MSTMGDFSPRIPHRSGNQQHEACLSSDSSLSSLPSIAESPDPLADFTVLPNHDSSADSDLLREDENDSQYADDDAFSESSVVPLAVRAKLFRLYDGKCWLCGVKAKQVAHVIAKSEHHLVVHPQVLDIFFIRKANTWCSFANTPNKDYCTSPLSTPSRIWFLCVPAATKPSMNGVRYGPSSRRLRHSSPAKKSFKLGDSCSRSQRLVSATPAPTRTSMESQN